MPSPNIEKRLAHYFEIPVLIAAALVVPTLIIEQLNPGGAWNLFANTLNWSIWLVFAAESITLFLASKRKKRWLREHLLEIAIVILSPPIMPPGLQSTRVLRLLRLARLIRLTRIAKLARQLFSLKGVYWAAFLSFIIVIGGGAAFTIVEKNQNLTSWDGIYWAISTVTAFGSAIAPSTNLGKTISIGVLFIGTGFVAILTAAIAERFMRYARANPKIQTADSEVIELLEDINSRLERIEKKLK